MLEQCRWDVARRPHGNSAANMHLSRGELIELASRCTNRRLMCSNDPLITADQRCDGDRLRRRQRKVVEHPPVCHVRIVSSISTRRLVPESQPLPSCRMLVLAQGQELFLCHRSRRAEHRRACPDPHASHTLAFRIIITDAKVLLEVALRVTQVVFRLRRKHGDHRMTGASLNLAPERAQRRPAFVREHCA